MSTTYVRVTITGERRNGEMLLPTDRQVAELMPEILQICGSAGHDRTPQALTLTPLGSATLRPHQTLEEAGVENGAVLSLDRRDEAVPRPVVFDLAEETERLSSPATSSLSIDLTRLISTSVFVLFGLLALSVATSVFDAQDRSGWGIVLSAAALVAMALLPRRILIWDVELLVLSGASLAMAFHWGLPEFPGSEWTIPVWLLAALSAWSASRRLWVSLLAIVVTAAALTLLWWGSHQVFQREEEVVAVAGVGSAVLLGLSPRTALTASGMHRLDDGIAHGDRPSVPAARSAFINAHTGLTSAVLLCATSLALAVHGLVSDGAHGWTLPLAILLTVLTALRARSMPLALERAALITSAAASTIVIVHATATHLPSWLLMLLPIVLALVPVMLRLRTGTTHHRARLRIIARRLEGLATLALLPLLIGLFGLYSRLIDTF